jgi:hypothetical protein
LDAPYFSFLSGNELLVGGVGYQEVVLLLTEAVLPSTVLVDEGGVAQRGRAICESQPHHYLSWAGLPQFGQKRSSGLNS